MDTVIVIPLEDVPEDLLAERRTRGLDRYDEVCAGELIAEAAPVP